MSVVHDFVTRIRATAKRRATTVQTIAMGQTRRFDAYDLGADTFIFEHGILSRLEERPSALIVDKKRLGRMGSGRVFTLTSGNHSVAAMPLLDGRFWRISTLPATARSEVLSTGVLCSNISNDTIEISQRETPTADLVRHDAWLREKMGFPLGNVVMAERTDSALDHFRKRGEEWRVKPLAWTVREMRAALDASRKRIASRIHYYHSSRGVHILSFPEFVRFAALARTDPASFVEGLRELVAVYEGNEVSFTRMPKYRGYYEIDFFGVERGRAVDYLVPELEKMLSAIESHRLGQLGVIQKIEEAVELYRTILSRAELADESSPVFIETIYMHVTGEVYSLLGGGTTPAFDDRRTALPGATFVEGRLKVHPGADSRTEVLLSNLRGMLSKGEIIEYANVYELREDETTRLGQGRTREVVYKTNLRPLETSLIEKGLSSSRAGYADYMLARVGALRAIGISLSRHYRLLRRRLPQKGRARDFYIRLRCEGEPMNSIPKPYFLSTEDSRLEDREVVRSLAMLMGDAAAQNMAMKKYEAASHSPLYGIGKEIYEFAHDVLRGRVVPKSVATCSIRGSFGWPNLEESDANFDALSDFYLTHFASTFLTFACEHSAPVGELAEQFMDGFEFRTHAMVWALRTMRDKFEAFHPALPKSYDFETKWKFVMWSLERQNERLAELRASFLRKTGEVK